MLQRVCVLSRKGTCLFRNSTVFVSGLLNCCNSDISNVTRTDLRKPNFDSHVLSRTFLNTAICNSRYKVLYDGDCTLCQKEIRVLKWITDLNNKPVDFVNIASVQYKAADNQGVTYEMAMREMHVIDPKGKVHSRAEAIRQMYEAVGLSLLVTVSRLPGLNTLTDRMYVRFAEYRLQKALNNCENGHCSVKVKHLRDKIAEESSQKKRI